MGANRHTSKGRRSGYRIMFTDDEKRAIEARANAEGVTIAELIRRALGLAEAPTVQGAHAFEHGSRESCVACARPFLASVHPKE